MLALDSLRWLLNLLQSDPALSTLLAPWRERIPQAFVAPDPAFIPDSQQLELAVWAAGFVGFPPSIMQRLDAAAPGQIEAWREQAGSALSRDPEPPLDWVGRALRHLPYWLENGLTPFAGYYSLRRLHFLTRGRSSRLIALIHQALQPTEAAPCPASMLELKQADLSDILSAVRSDSVTVLPKRLPPVTVDEIVAFARTTPCYPSLANQEHRDPVTGENLLPKLLFDPSAPLAHRYDFNYSEIWECQAIQRLAADPIWPWLAEQYLGARTRLTMAYLWWSSAFDGPQSRYTGQVFHVDVDRFQFVNFFFYLCDVGSDNGPQVYVTGSHADMPLELALDQRWRDQDMTGHYGPDRLREIHGPAGSVIMADTLAYHKGKTLNAGTRLMFQMEFASSTLGENTPDVPRPAQVTPELAHVLLSHPQRFPRLAGWA